MMGSCDKPDHERFRNVFFATRGCLACELESTAAELASLRAFEREFTDDCLVVGAEEWAAKRTAIVKRAMRRRDEEIAKLRAENDQLRAELQRRGHCEHGYQEPHFCEQCRHAAGK